LKERWKTLLLWAFALVWYWVVWRAGNWFVFKASLGYGIRIEHPMLAAIGVILVFAALYGILLPDKICQNESVAEVHGFKPWFVSRFTDGNVTAEIHPKGGVCSIAEIEGWGQRSFTALYFSAITFTTIGYGDWHPEGWARLFAASEGLIGLILIAAFTVILVRKIIR
ncbi:MAG: potassium channel family protein, partial [Planctomycetia bacterium]|nr:potassium channel family protein [Planctomycetia bacterium]